jgi:Flp pilus assembly protein TadD
MSYAPGGSADSRLKGAWGGAGAAPARLFSAAETLAIAYNTASALAHIHAAGEYHFDVKPANILVDHHGRAKLADFGIAQSASTVVDSRLSLGTLRYMSPEQLEGKAVDHRSDIFSLGIVLHELLTGEMPYGSLEPQALRRDILAGTPRLSAGLPRGYEAICRKALSRDPHKRQASAAEFAAELRRVGDRDVKGRAWVVALMSLMLVTAAGVAASRLLQKETAPASVPAQISNDEVLAEATNLFFQKKFVEAETLFTTYLEHRPDDLEALTRRGLCRTGRGAFASGVQDFTQAIALAPDDARLHKQRAMAFASLRQFEPAIADYEAAIALDPGDRETRESFGACYSIMAAEKAEPGSGQPDSKGTRRIWAVDEIGSNSVMPCTTPKIAACPISSWAKPVSIPPVHTSAMFHHLFGE